MRISDWSSDVCSSDLFAVALVEGEDLVVLPHHIEMAVGQRRRAAQRAAGALLPQDGACVRVDRRDIADAGAGIEFSVDEAEAAAEQGAAADRGGERGLPRSAERREGKECVSTGKSRWAQDN